MNNIYHRAGICPNCKTYCTNCTYHHQIYSEKWIRSNIIDFFRHNSYPDEKQLVDLAKELGLSKRQLDQKMVLLLADFIHKDF